MKKIFAILLALLLFLILAPSTALAAGYGDGDIEIKLGEIKVVPDDGFYESTNVTISGSIYVLSSAEALGLFPYTAAYSEGGYEITNPNGDVKACDALSDGDFDWGWFCASAEAEVCLPWEVEIKLEGKPGEWEASQYGLGMYFWEYWKFFWPKWKCGGDFDENSIKFSSIPDNRKQIQVGMPFGGAGCQYDDTEGTYSDLFMVGLYGGSQYAILIPKHTRVEDANGLRPLKVWLGSLVGNAPTTSPSVTFSQACTLYKVDGYMYRSQAGEWVGGTLVEVGKF